MTHSRKNPLKQTNAGRLTQFMLRIAARRALHAVHVSFRILGMPFRARDAIVLTGLGEGPNAPATVLPPNASEWQAAPDERCVQPPPGVPGSFQEFLQVLAAELEQADRDDLTASRPRSHPYSSSRPGPSR